MTALIRRAGLALALLLAALPLQAQVIGHIDGVSASGGVTGWACQVGHAASIQVHIYAGGPAGSGAGLGSIAANRASEAAVAQRCGTSGTAYRFAYPLSVAVRKQYANKKIYVHGISPTGGSNLTIQNSGLYGVPPTLTLTRHYVYDGRQQLCKTIEPETGATAMAYDAAGNLFWSASGLNLPSTTTCDLASVPRAPQVTRSYDARNRLIGLEFSDGIGDQIWQYTPDSLPTQIETTNQGGRLSTTVYSYNRRRLLVGEATAFGGTQWGLGYGYDAHGALASMTYPNNLSVSYAPNALGQPTRVGDYATQARYHPNGALAGFTYGNGVAWTLTQNARGLPYREDSVGIQRYEYWYDANGNPTHLHDQTRGNAYSRNLQYDAADRLTGAGSASFGGDHWHRFRYDALDNLNAWTHAGVKDYSRYIYDHNFRLIEVRNAAGATQVTLGYNALGNVTLRNGRNHNFDYGNRLREVQGREWYTYDAHGRRQLACGPSACNYQHYGQDGRLYFSQNYGTGRRENYLYLGDKQVAIREAAVGNNNQDVQVKYQHTDLLGSPVAITDAAGAVLERTHWAPYGAAIDKSAYDGIGYTGHRQDGATGLVYMQQRYYDPGIGLFLSVDPVTALGNPVGQFNRYRYGNNSPYAFVDPDGQCGTRIKGAASVNCMGFQFVRPLGEQGGTSGGVGAGWPNGSFNIGNSQDRYNAASYAVKSVSGRVGEIRHETLDSAAQTVDHVFQPISERFGVEVLSRFDGGLGAGYYVVDTQVGQIFSSSGIGYTVSGSGGAGPSHHTHPLISGGSGSYSPFSLSDIDWYRSNSDPHYVSDSTGLYRFNGVSVPRPVTKIPRLGR